MFLILAFFRDCVLETFISDKVKQEFPIWLSSFDTSQLGERGTPLNNREELRIFELTKKATCLRQEMMNSILETLSLFHLPRCLAALCLTYL